MCLLSTGWPSLTAPRSTACARPGPIGGTGKSHGDGSGSKPQELGVSAQLAHPSSAFRAVCSGLRSLLRLATGVAARYERQRQGWFYAATLWALRRRHILLGAARPNAWHGLGSH